jgi:1-acyl-sn-glycerol-3-phosphate acyltransferase
MNKTLTTWLPYLSRKKSDPLRSSLTWEFYRDLWLLYLRLAHGIGFRGRRNIPARGPLIIAPNHVSYYDPPAVGCGVPQRIRTMAWDALFRIPVFRSVIRSLGAFPVKLKTAHKSAIQESLKVLRNNECLMMFPEGARSPTGGLQPFAPGMARLALQTGASILPVTITGAHKAWPRTCRLPRPGHRILIKYHMPVPVAPVRDRATLPDRIEEVNAAVEKPIRRRLAAYERLQRMRQSGQGRNSRKP